MTNENEDLKQLKTDTELQAKCNEIIDSLKDFNKVEKFKILMTLTSSFLKVCKEEGIDFIELEKEK
jgi:hypothetical protein